ncbi:MAG: RNA 2',3'-cyclic phosphodiesterase [Candidatus Komeilibacteria bacterium]|nr:RNA 2',3'-cyclic phosphodiesterase [Candidatus Komeilibacteria bacterium]
MPRVFLGIDLPDNLKAKIEDFKLSNKLNKLPLKLVEQENAHIAIKFLDDLTDEQIAKVSQNLRQNIVDFKSFTVQIKDSLVFPNLEQPRVLALKVISSNLEGLVKKISRGWIGLDFIPVEERKYTPHITLGRVKDDLTAREKEKIFKLTFEESFMAAAIQLFESKLMPAGPSYKILEEFKLK